MLLGEIDALSKMRGYCDASRSHFAEWLGVKKPCITYYFEKLERLGFIKIDKTPGQRNKIRLISERFYIEQGVSPTDWGGSVPLTGGVSPTDWGGQSHLPEIKEEIKEEIKKQNNAVAPSSLLATTVELVEVEADEKSAVEEKKEVTNRSVAPLPPTPLPAEPTQPAVKPKRKGKNSSEPFTYRDMAKYMDIPVQVFFSEIIRNEAWPKWIEYKKNKKKFEYDAADSAAAVVRKLHSISGGDPSKAAEIILQSRSSGWAGLFPLESQQQQRQPYQNQQQPRQRSEVDGLVFSR